MSFLIETCARKPTENRQTYEEILNRSRARYPDTVFPDTVNFDSKVHDETLNLRLAAEIRNDEKSTEPICFDQLHKNATRQRFVSVDEMKFLIFVNCFLRNKRNFRAISVLGFQTHHLDMKMIHIL